MKNILLSLSFIICYMNAYSQNGLISKGQIISYSKGEFRITKIHSSDDTPSQKVKASDGNHYILISLELLKIENDEVLSSSCFLLTDNANNKYENYGAWGEIEVMGSISNFEAIDGSTVYVRNQGESLNLIFEVPKATLPQHISLQYSEKCDLNESGIKGKTEPKDYTIKDIKLFGFAGDRPERKDRFYSTYFKKENIGSISVEVSFENHLYNEKYQEHPIEYIWYDAEGRVEGKLSDTVRIQSDWNSPAHTSNGWGYSEPGKWTTGEYKVEILIDGEKIGERNFFIIEKQYELESIKLFSIAENKPKRGNRVYKKSYAAETLQFISVELGLSNLLYGKVPQELEIILNWYDNIGEYEGRVVDTVKIKPEWKSASYTNDGWGYLELGKWTPGTYKVDIYIDKAFVGEETFEVNNVQPVKYTVEPFNNRNVIQASFAVNDRGNQFSFINIFDKDNNEILCAKDTEITVLKELSRSVNPLTTTMHNGDVIVGEENEMEIYGQILYAVAGDSTKMTSFRRKGEGENLLGIGSSGSAVWADTYRDEKVKIGEIKWDVVEGVGHELQIIKGTHSSAEWTTSFNGQIVEITDTGNVQIGWVSWREIRLPDNKTHTIIMTKTMSSNAKWIGRFDGKLYETE